MIRCISLLLLLTFVFASGCGGRKVRSDGGADAPGPVGPAGPAAPGSVDGEMGPPIPPVGTSAEGPVGPEPAPGYAPPKDGYVLVLGPGLARGLAYLGVLREMEERQLPVRAIVGVEMGALVGAIWASANLNSLEWEMHKFRRDTLLDVSILRLRGRVAEGKKLLEFLDQGLKVNLLQKMKVPVLVASAVRGASEEALLVESSGPAREIIRGAMGIPGILKPFTWDGKERATAALESPFPTSQAKALGLGKLICVDAVGRGDNFTAKDEPEEHLAALMRSVSVLARQQLKECDIVLAIPMEGVSYLGFDAKADLIYRGRQAVQKWAEQAK